MKTQEQSNTETSVNDQNNSDLRSNSNQLVERYIVDETPFTIIKLQTDQGPEWFVTMGKNRLTPKLKSYDECTAWTEKITWNNIIQVITIMLENQDKIKELLKQIDETKEPTAPIKGNGFDF